MLLYKKKKKKKNDVSNFEQKILKKNLKYLFMNYDVVGVVLITITTKSVFINHLEFSFKQI